MVLLSILSPSLFLIDNGDQGEEEGERKETRRKISLSQISLFLLPLSPSPFVSLPLSSSHFVSLRLTSSLFMGEHTLIVSNIHKQLSCEHLKKIFSAAVNEIPKRIEVVGREEEEEKEEEWYVAQVTFGSAHVV